MKYKREYTGDLFGGIGQNDEEDDISYHQRRTSNSPAQN